MSCLGSRVLSPASDTQTVSGPCICTLRFLDHQPTKYVFLAGVSYIYIIYTVVFSESVMHTSCFFGVNETLAGFCGDDSKKLHFDDHITWDWKGSCL